VLLSFETFCLVPKIYCAIFALLAVTGIKRGVAGSTVWQ
jgi:hypothetical protein